MNARTIPADLACIGCRYCELRAGDNDRNTLTCINPSIAAGPLPADVTLCFVQDTETEGGDHD